jgi:serine protease Do
MNRVRRWSRIAIPAILVSALAIVPIIGATQAIGAERSFIGVHLQPLTEDLAKAFGAPASTRGVVVTAVQEGSPAAVAGMKPSDIIVEYDGQAVTTPRELSQRVAATPTGKAVSMKVLRNGQEMTFSPTTAAMTRPSEAGEGDTAGGPKAEGQGADRAKFGLVLQPLTPELAKQLQMTQEKGLVVRAVRPGSKAEQAGIKRGDVITEVNRQSLTSVEELRAALDQATPEKPAVLLVHRDGGTWYLTVKG